MTITLYAAPMSSAIPVLNALIELEVPFEMVTLDLKAGDQRQPAFLALNPNGKVPTLVVDGTPMFEALAILCWLGENFGVGRDAWPTPGSPDHLQALSWSAWAYVTFGGWVNHVASPRVPAEWQHPALAERAHRELQQLLGILDGRLAARPYLLGDTFSLVDLIVGSVVTYGTYCGVPVEAHPNVTAWLARFHARPSYRKTWGVGDAA